MSAQGTRRKRVLPSTQSRSAGGRLSRGSSVRSKTSVLTSKYQRGRPEEVSLVEGPRNHASGDTQIHTSNNCSRDTTLEASSPGYFQRREIPVVHLAFKCAISKRATIFRESGRRTFNHSTGSKSQPCHARGGNTRETTNYCAKYKPKLRQALYGCKDGGDQTARQTMERNSGHNRTGLSRPNRQSNLERNPQEDSQDIRPFGISFTRHLSWKDTVQRNMRRPSTLGLRFSQRAKDRVGELGKSVDWKSRSPKEAKSDHRDAS